MQRQDLILEFGLATDLFWDPLCEDDVKAAAQHGFAFFEIWGHLPWFDIYSASAATEVKNLVNAHGMRVRSIHAPCEGDWDISSEHEPIREKSSREVVLAIERCREVGGELVVVHPGRRLISEGKAGESEHERRIRQSMKSFVEIQNAAKDNGIRLALENQWANEVGGKTTHFVRLLDTLDRCIVGICFDSSHANITPGTYAMFDAISHPIITTHLSDNHGIYDEHKPPFTAGIDWVKTLDFLTGRGFRGPWLFEVTNGGSDPLEVLATMGRSVKKIEETLTRR